MREILFRGQRACKGSYSNENKGDWIYGYYVKIDDIDYIIPKDKHAQAIPVDVQFIPIIPETLGQFTGLPDKDGKKIFEGDIVKIKTYYGWQNKPVVYSDKKGCFYAGEKHAHGMGDKGGGLRLLTGPIYVQGNIHENPDLLETQ